MRTLLLITPSKASIPLLSPRLPLPGPTFAFVCWVFVVTISHKSSVLSGAPHDDYRARWFELCEDQVTGEQVHIYKGGYWEAKELGSWAGCQDIY